MALRDIRSVWSRNAPISAGLVITRLVERAKLTKSKLLYPGKAGAARTGCCKALRRAMDTAGLNEPTLVRQFGKLTTHSLRHTYASWLRQGGVKLDDLQPLLGHADIKTTMVYAHILERDSMAAAVTAFAGVDIGVRSMPKPTSANDSSPTLEGPIGSRHTYGTPGNPNTLDVLPDQF